MDPVTQGAFGAVFGQLHGRKKDLAKAAAIGALAGMAPDLDILIRSDEDPLLALEYHRHFTHSLLFIPIGGLIVSLFLHPLLGRRWGLTFMQTLLWSIIGFSTHALLDTCTSYGTQLLWPLTNMRFSTDTISVVDPLVTVPILVLTILAARKKSRAYAFAAVAWIALYFSAAFIQHERAIEAGTKLAESRNLNVVSIAAKPSFANIFVWKIITETDDRFYIDAIKPTLGEPVVWEGESSLKLDIDRDLPWLDKSSQQAKDIERFRWFSMDYIALDKEDPNRVVDVRYSLLPQQIKPLWGIELSRDAAPDDHIVYYQAHDDRGGSASRLWQMIWE
ncbi:metal-dependent hydrolase [Leucothrix sargassi]|nr:metal-dependent hydrolase [Leucothrix sargassi]